VSIFVRVISKAAPDMELPPVWEEEGGNDIPHPLKERAVEVIQ
jgi:hypothetical protein